MDTGMEQASCYVAQMASHIHLSQAGIHVFILNTASAVHPPNTAASHFQSIYIIDELMICTSRLSPSSDFVHSQVPVTPNRRAFETRIVPLPGAHLTLISPSAPNSPQRRLPVSSL
ncbi:hypothetical protein NKR23_g11581 [Pleurostoma richardsiae]|uniref:Uncharacterized protein n=1 Tax=Pleurostoma richardsiae TaxID=41990 RepID=A0AA38R2V7_9PEZI|nr:hypothetical protein NKR23_g11581 [Pleurostoma richardsiae]